MILINDEPVISDLWRIALEIVWAVRFPNYSSYTRRLLTKKEHLEQVIAYLKLKEADYFTEMIKAELIEKLYLINEMLSQDDAYMKFHQRFLYLLNESHRILLISQLALQMLKESIARQRERNEILINILKDYLNALNQIQSQRQKNLDKDIDRIVDSIQFKPFVKVILDKKTGSYFMQDGNKMKNQIKIQMRRQINQGTCSINLESITRQCIANEIELQISLLNTGTKHINTQQVIAANQNFETEFISVVLEKNKEIESINKQIGDLIKGKELEDSINRQIQVLQDKKYFLDKIEYEIDDFLHPVSDITNMSLEDLISINENQLSDLSHSLDSIDLTIDFDKELEKEVAILEARFQGVMGKNSKTCDTASILKELSITPSAVSMAVNNQKSKVIEEGTATNIVENNKHKISSNIKSKNMKISHEDIDYEKTKINPKKGP